MGKKGKSKKPVVSIDLSDNESPTNRQSKQPKEDSKFNTNKKKNNNVQKLGTSKAKSEDMGKGLLKVSWIINLFLLLSPVMCFLMKYYN